MNRVTIELRQWRYFLAVADERNVTRAAARLHLDQPSLSRQLRQLERRLGVQLFVRTTRSVALSPAGEQLLAPARQLSEAAAALEALAVQAAREAAGTLRVGTPEWYPYTGSLGAVVRALAVEDPPLLVELEHISWWEHQVAVLDRRIDAGYAVAQRPGDLPAALVAEPLRADRVRHALLAAEHPLTERPTVTAAVLAGEPMFVPPAGLLPYVTVGTVESIRSAAGREPVLAPAPEGFAQVIQSVAAGAGWTIVPDSMAEHPPTGTTTRPIADVDIDQSIFLLWRADVASERQRRLASGLRAALAAETRSVAGPAGSDESRVARRSTRR